MSDVSQHAASRMHQRGVPPIVVEWLGQFGEEAFDGHGGIVRYFSRRSRRRLERQLGHRFVAENQKYLDRYIVESAVDGRVITAGVRHKPINRR